MKCKILFLTLLNLYLFPSGRRDTPTVPTILQMQRIQERAEEELISQERQHRQKANMQIILSVLNKNLRTDLNNNSAIAEGLAREIEIQSNLHDLELRIKIKKYLIQMNVFSRKK